MVGRARKVQNDMKQYKTLLYMHFLLDMLQEASILSLSFQQDACTITSSGDALGRFMLGIEALKHQNGENLERFLTEVGEGSQWQEIELSRNMLDKQQFENAKVRILNTIIDHTQKRFDLFENDNLLKASKFIDPMDWPVSDNELAIFGVDFLNTVALHFEEPLQRQGFDIRGARREWIDMKAFSRRHMQGWDLVRFWNAIHTQHRARFINLCWMAEIILSYPLSTACCERGFSIMKRVKSDWRASLDPQTLSMLMRIAIDGPSISEFDPKRAVEYWWFSGSRARRPNYID
jgi:hypothetical protein